MSIEPGGATFPSFCAKVALDFIHDARSTKRREAALYLWAQLFFRFPPYSFFRTLSFYPLSICKPILFLCISIFRITVVLRQYYSTTHLSLGFFVRLFICAREARRNFVHFVCWLSCGKK
jgi:hypothetical protein